MKWYKSSKVIAAVGALLAAVVALVAALAGWSAEVVALVGAVIAAGLGVWRALAVKSGKGASTMLVIALIALSSCTSAQRRAIAITTISSSAEAARCVLACIDEQCQSACAMTYGATIARDLVAHIMTAAAHGATEMKVPVPQVYTQDELDAMETDKRLDVE